MKKCISIITMLMLAACAVCQDAATLAREGDSRYHDGDYAGAIESYEAALSTGRGSAEVLYNLGNAYYRDNQIARAILNYERALRLRPGMKDARENLELAYGRTQDRIAELPQWFAARWWDTLTTQVTPSTWRTVWLLVLALLAVAVVGLRLGIDRGLRRWSLAGGIVALLLLAATTVVLVASTKSYNAHSAAIVMQESVAVKSSPEARSADKLILHEGTRVRISESLRGWDKVTIADGTSGWCPAEAVERI